MTNLLFLQADFGLGGLWDSLSSNLGGALPKVLSALLVLIIGLFLAGVIRRLIAKALRRSGLDSRFSSSSFSLANTVSKLLYYVIVVIVLMAVLNMMGITDALAPLQNMLNEITGYLPNIIGAGIIGFVGYTLANIAKEGVGFISGSVEHFTDKYGLSKDFDLTALIKQIVFIIIFFPILLVALDTLNMKAVSEPAKKMLTSLFDAIPNILAAGIVLAVFYIVGKFVVGIVGELLKNLNIDKYADNMGVSSLTNGTNLSDMITKILYFFIMFFGVITAVEKLEFAQLSGVLNNVLEMSGQILFGGVILLIGNKLSQMASDYFKNGDSPALASIVRFATLGLFVAMALKYMGLADDIVNLAFGLTLGAVAVAFALSFGLGGKDAAGRQMGKFLDKF